MIGREKIRMTLLIRAVITFLFLFWIGMEEEAESLEWNINKMNNNLIYRISQNVTVSDYNQEDLDPTEIVSKMLEKLKKILKNGDKEHDLPSVDPQWFSIKRKVEEENLQLTMILDGQVSNTSNLQWTNLYTCPLTMQIQMEVLVKDVFINGTYNLTGMAYDAFPIFGDGDFQVNIEDVRLIVTAEVSPKQGDNPLQMDNLNAHFMDLHGLKMNFENLMGDTDMALLLSQLAADFSEKVAYDVASEMEKTPNEVIYSIVSDRISQLTLLDIVSSINSF